MSCTKTSFDKIIDIDLATTQNAEGWICPMCSQQLDEEFICRKCMHIVRYARDANKNAKEHNTARITNNIKLPAAEIESFHTQCMVVQDTADTRKPMTEHIDN